MTPPPAGHVDQRPGARSGITIPLHKIVSCVVTSTMIEQARRQHVVAVYFLGVRS